MCHTAVCLQLEDFLIIKGLKDHCISEPEQVASFRMMFSLEKQKDAASSDTASFFIEVMAVHCEPDNGIPYLLTLAANIYMAYRTGFGIDFHQLVEGRDLWLGGIQIPHYKGSLGHSDADVLLHAICDAMLGALALGDIGIHFPNTAAEYKNIDSKILLQKTYELIYKKNYIVVNVDSTVCLELPKIKPHTEAMRKEIATILELEVEDVSIKATTTEKMGFAGREEGLVAYATVLLRKRK